MTRLIYGQRTDIGLLRTTNEDAIASTMIPHNAMGAHSQIGIFLVVDGMGGIGAGEAASMVAIFTILDFLDKAFLEPTIMGRNTPSLGDLLTKANQAANSEIIQKTQDSGATMTSILTVDNFFCIGHVGDTRAFLVNKYCIVPLTRIHDFLNSLLERGLITWEEALNRPMRNVLYRALGQSSADIEVDIITGYLSEGDSLLICSDGVYQSIDEHKLWSVIRDIANPQDACNRIIALANDCDGRDNSSVMLIRAIQD